MDEFLEPIKLLIYELTGSSNIKIERATRIYEDLKIDGDDAFELLEAFRDRFQVDMVGFDFNEYFNPEGVDLIKAFITIFKKNKKKLKALTVGHLECIAKNGKWISPYN